MLEEKYFEIWMDAEHIVVVSDEIRFLTMYHIEGCIAIISAWAKEGFSRLKKEVIAIIHKVDEQFEKTVGK